MTYKNILNATTKVFKQKMNEFCENGGRETCETLGPEALEQLSRALLSAFQAGGQAGLKTYLESHDIRKAVVTAKGTSYRYKNSMEKTFLTLMGEVVVNRSIYANDLLGGGYHVPLDAALGLCDDYATLETREMIFFAASVTTPGDVEVLLRKTGLCHPSSTAIQNMINKDGKRIEENGQYFSQKVLASTTIPEKTAVMVSSLDGANLLLREPGKKKGRKTQRPVGSGAAEDEKNTSFRNAMVGAFSFYEHDDEGKPQRISSSYIARTPEEKAPIFKEEFERTIIHYQNESSGDTFIRIFLCDGHRAIWNYAYHCPVLKGHLFLVDFYHTTEHLSKAAEAIFGASSEYGKRWYLKWRDALKTDANAPQSIIRSIDGYLERCKLPKGRADEVKKELTFFKRNKKLMHYSEFVNNGYPIGSGPVEAAAKTIVKQRMCRSAMRWSRPGAQYILTLRAQVKSGTWDAFWKNYVALRVAA
jgi:hypothetical protein